MTDSLQPLLIAMSTFVIGHFVLASLPVRHAAIGMIGVNGFRILFSIFALATLVWAVRAYIAAPYAELWALREAEVYGAREAEVEQWEVHLLRVLRGAVALE